MKKQILDIALEGLTIEESVSRLMMLLTEEKVSISAFVRAGMLLEAEKNETYREMLKKLDLAMVVDTEILKVMGEKNEDDPEEIEVREVIDAFLIKLAEEKRSVVILTEGVEEKIYLEEYLQEVHPELIIKEVLILDSFEEEDDVINHINGMDVDVMLAELSTPQQEYFIFQHRLKLNIGLWLGMGKYTAAKKKTETGSGFFGKLMEKRMFKKKVTQYF